MANTATQGTISFRYDNNRFIALSVEGVLTNVNNNDNWLYDFRHESVGAFNALDIDWCEANVGTADQPLVLMSTADFLKAITGASFMHYKPMGSVRTYTAPNVKDISSIKVDFNGHVISSE